MLLSLIMNPPEPSNYSSRSMNMKENIKHLKVTLGNTFQVINYQVDQERGMRILLQDMQVTL